MDKQSNQEAINKKPSRRQFLQGILGTGALAILPKNLPAIQEQEIMPKEWHLEEVLLDPTELLDTITEKINKIPQNERNTQLQSFLNSFKPGEENEPSQYQNLIDGYKQFGQQIINIRQKLINTNLIPGYSVDFNTPFFSDLISPFSELISLASVPDIKNLSISQHGLAALSNTSNWIATDGWKYPPNMDVLKDNIHGEWEFYRKYQRISRIDDREYRPQNGEEIQIQTLEKLNEYLPLALSGFRFSSFVNGRGYFTNINNSERVQFMPEYPFFRALELKEQIGNRTLDIDWGTAQDYFTDHLVSLLHETNHGFDPLFTTQQVNNINLFYLTKPQDYFNYLESYTNMFMDFTDFLDNAPASDLEGLLLDQLSIREGFGVDEILNENDAQNVLSEMDDLFQVCVLIENADPETAQRHSAILEETGLDKFFSDNSDEMLLCWQNTFPNLPPDFADVHTSYQKVFRENVTSFNRISKQQIIELKTVVYKTFIENPTEYTDFEKREIAKRIINIKSTYMLGSYSLLRNLDKQGELNMQTSHVLYPIYQKLALAVNWQLAHVATGPMGEYLTMSYMPPDIRIDQENYLNTVVDRAEFYRESDYSVNFSNQYSSTVPLFLEKLYSHVGINIQRARAKMLGATNPDTVYQDLTKDIINNVLGLDDLYGRSVG